MAWSDAARAAAREARRRKGTPQSIERRYRRTIRGYNSNKQQAIKLGDTLAKLESKTDSWGREKHSAMQMKIQDAQRAVLRRQKRWRMAENAYRIVQGKEPIK